MKNQTLTNMLSQETNAYAQKRIADILESIQDLEDCAAASKVIDMYQRDFPNERQFIWQVRNLLCDITFDKYIEKYPKSK